MESTSGDAPERSAVQVAVRVRPLSAGESAQGSEPCVSVLGGASVLVGGLSGKQYDFDAAFAPGAAQHELYDALVAPLVDRFFDGYNATVFAYGQTGSGKTFTMGNEFKLDAAHDERGIIPRTMDEIFKRIASAPPSTKYALKVSYLEILNEEIHDLLAGSSSSAISLSVRDDGKRGICVNGLSEHAVESIEQVANVLHTGALTRATASTNMNAQSSRSHAICTLTMEQYETSLECGAEAKFSKFHLVDLAGSERAKRTNAEGARFKEGVNINKGLLSLGNVINALSEKNSHVPYRDSKLTRLLQDSLGGNSKTLMIACISPADVNFEETCNTLRYASRARNIQNQAVVNQTLTAESQLAYLKQQLEVTQLQLLQYQQGKGPIARSCVTGNAGSVSSFEVEILEKEILRWKSIAKTREEELQLVMSAKDKWKKIADDFSSKKQRGVQGGAVRVNSTTGDCHSPRSKAMLQDAVEFEKSIQVTQFTSVSSKTVESEIEATETDETETSWESNIDSLEDVIKEKERIVLALSAATSLESISGGDNEGPLTALSKGYEQKIRELELQISQLTEEKTRLARGMPASSDATGTDSPQRRLHAQLQVAQNQLQVARQAEKECKRLTRLWKSGTLKISTLEKEIIDMKKQKASLQRKLKEESEAHRKEKREQNLKIIQLKRQEQRKQYELQKLTSLHVKQNNVLKRKNEEIASVNKRMRTLVQNQQSAQQMRIHSAKHKVSASMNRLGPSSAQDKTNDSNESESMGSILKVMRESIDVQLTIAGAKTAIQMELEERKKMALEIARLENQGNHLATPDKLEELKGSLREKNSDIRLMQQKLASVEKNTALPSALFPTKLTTCHQLIRQLMESVIESKTALVEIDNYKSDLETVELQLVEQSERHEEVVAAYKRQLHKLGHFDSVEISQPSSREKEIEDLKLELTKVRAELDKVRKVGATVSKSSPEVSTAKPKKVISKQKLAVDVEMVEILSSSDEEDEEDDDSDYIEEEENEEGRAKRKKSLGGRAGAPVGGRGRLPLKPRPTPTNNVMDEIDMLLSKPSAVAGNICCSCNGKCATKSCACRAEKQSCGPDCSCKESKCHNRGDVLERKATKKRRSDPLLDDKENEVESFFSQSIQVQSQSPRAQTFLDMMDKENAPPPHKNTDGVVDKENVPPPQATKLKKLWSGSNIGGLGPAGASAANDKSANFSATPSMSVFGLSKNNHNHKASAIARFF